MIRGSDTLNGVDYVKNTIKTEDLLDSNDFYPACGAGGVFADIVAPYRVNEHVSERLTAPMKKFAEVDENGKEIEKSQVHSWNRQLWARHIIPDVLWYTDDADLRTWRYDNVAGNRYVIWPDCRILQTG